MKLSEVVQGIDGKLIRDAEFEALNFCTASPSYKFLSFMEKAKFIDRMNENVSCVICTPEMQNQLPDMIAGVFLSMNPKYDFYCIHNKLSALNEKKDTFIDDSAIISDRAVIADKNVKIGRNVVIEANVVINENVTIEDNVIIHSNSVIGGRSFDFAKSSDGKMVGWIDAGNVLIRTGVEICSSAHIAQACLSEDVTLLDENCKIDSFVHLGHGAHIGKRSLIAAGAIIGGNSVVGDDSWVGINATVSNRVIVGNNARLSLGSVATKNVDDNATVTGNFAIEHHRFLENLKRSID